MQVAGTSSSSAKFLQASDIGIFSSLAQYLSVDMYVCSQVEEDDTRGSSYLGPKKSLLPGYGLEVELSTKIIRPSSDASMMRLLTTCLFSIQGRVPMFEFLTPKPSPIGTLKLGMVPSPSALSLEFPSTNNEIIRADRLESISQPLPVLVYLRYIGILAIPTSLSCPIDQPPPPNHQTAEPTTLSLPSRDTKEKEGVEKEAFTYPTLHPSPKAHKRPHMHTHAHRHTLEFYSPSPPEKEKQKRSRTPRRRTPTPRRIPSRLCASVPLHHTYLTLTWTYCTCTCAHTTYANLPYPTLPVSHLAINTTMANIRHTCDNVK